MGLGHSRPARDFGLTPPWPEPSFIAVGILRLSHIGVCVRELEASLAFYRDLLGFEEISRLEVAGEAADQLLGLEGTELKAVYLERDGTRIELLYYQRPGTTGDSLPRPMNALGLTHLSLRVEDLAGMLDRLRSAGVKVLEDTYLDFPEFRSGAVFVTDPDGTRVELLESPTDPDSLPGVH